MDFEDISRVNWRSDQSLGARNMNRLQTEIIRFEATMTKSSVLIHEDNQVSVNVNSDSRKSGFP